MAKKQVNTGKKVDSELTRLTAEAVFGGGAMCGVVAGDGRTRTDTDVYGFAFAMAERRTRKETGFDSKLKGHIAWVSKRD